MGKEIQSLEKYTPLIPWVIGGTVVGVLGIAGFYIVSKLKGLDPRTWFGDIPAWLEDLFPDVGDSLPEFPAKTINSTFKTLYDDCYELKDSKNFWDYYYELDAQFEDRFEWTTIRVAYRSMGNKLDEQIKQYFDTLDPYEGVPCESLIEDFKRGYISWSRFKKLCPDYQQPPEEPEPPPPPEPQECPAGYYWDYFENKCKQVPPLGIQQPPPPPPPPPSDGTTGFYEDPEPEPTYTPPPPEEPPAIICPPGFQYNAATGRCDPIPGYIRGGE